MAFRRDQLRYFVAVADAGQVTGAAAKLHMAQPALSQAIATLEEDVGFRLLERHARGVSLTPAGDLFLEKARTAVAANDEAAKVADALARSEQGAIDCGFLGLPPAITNPELVQVFAATHPDIELDLRELPFPSLPVASWLADVDVAIATRPAAEAGVWSVPLTRMRRVLLVPRANPLAQRSEVSVAEVFDETFLGFASEVDPQWAGFWTLDDHRGGPPSNVSGESATAQERFAMIASGAAVTTMPELHANVIAKVTPTLAAVPLRDADPALITLVGREDCGNPCVESLRAIAAEITSHRPESD